RCSTLIVRKCSARLLLLLSDVNAKSQALGVAVSRTLVELLDQGPAVGNNHALRSNIIFIGRDLNVWQSFFLSFGQYEAQRFGRIAVVALPRHDAVADVPKTRRRKDRRSGLPAKADIPCKLTIPHPTVNARKPFDERTIGQSHRTRLCSTILERLKK